MHISYKGMENSKVRFNKNSFVIENAEIKRKISGITFVDWLNNLNNFLVFMGEQKAIIQ